MLGDKRIVLLMVLDKKNHSFTGLTRRVMEHHRMLEELSRDRVVVVGRKTQELTGWKGPNLWVLSETEGWTRNGVKVAKDLSAVCSLPTDALYIAGGISVFKQFEPHVDEYRLWTVHSREGDEECTSMVPSHWKPVSYSSQNNWSYAQLKRAVKRLTSSKKR